MPNNLVPRNDLSSRNSSEATFHQGSLGLTDGEKFHTVVGIALNSVLIPGLKSYVDKEVEKHYNEMPGLVGLQSKLILDPNGMTFDTVGVFLFKSGS